MAFAFNFDLHADGSSFVGTNYFELLPGPYQGRHWISGARFIHEPTFCLIEGIFEDHIPEYDHYGFVDVWRPQWSPILAALSDLETTLRGSAGGHVYSPIGNTLRLDIDFATDAVKNQQGLNRARD